MKIFFGHLIFQISKFYQIKKFDIHGHEFFQINLQPVPDEVKDITHIQINFLKPPRIDLFPDLDLARSER